MSKLMWGPGEFTAYEVETALVRLRLQRHDGKVHWQADFYGDHGISGTANTVEQAKADSIDVTVRTMHGVIKQLLELKDKA